MSHYYTNDPGLPHETKSIQYSIGAVNLTFLTDAGVFSRQKVDYGSNVLIRTLPPIQGSVLDLGCGYGPVGISIAALNRNCQVTMRSEEHTSELLSRPHLVCRLLLEKKKQVAT